MVGANPPVNRMYAIVAARYSPLILPQPMNPLPSGDYLKYMPKFMGEEVSLSAKSVTPIGGGVIKPRVGKSFEVWGLDQGTTSRESGVKRISPSNPRPGGENSTITLPKFKVRETPAEGIIVE